jgi:hypothetical protein
VVLGSAMWPEFSYVGLGMWVWVRLCGFGYVGMASGMWVWVWLCGFGYVVLVRICGSRYVGLWLNFCHMAGVEVLHLGAIDGKGEHIPPDSISQ